MIYLYLCVVVVMPLMLSLITSSGMIYYCAFIGPLLIGSDASEITGAMFGKIDVNAFRLLGVIIGSFIIIIKNFNKIYILFKICFFHILFLLFATLSVVWSDSLIFSLRMLAKLIAPFLIVVAVPVAIKNEKIEFLLKVIFASCLVCALIAIYFAIFNNRSSSKLTYFSMSAAVFSSNMIIGLVISLNSKFLKGFTKIIFILLFSVCIIFADTRITIAAMFVVYSVYFFFTSKNIFKFIFPLSAMFSFVSLFLFVEKFRERMFFGDAPISVTNAHGVNNALNRMVGSGRFAAWEAVLNKFFYTSPLVGSGVGATQSFFYNSKFKIGAIHSEYIRLLTELGIFGLALFLLATLVYLFVIFHNYKFGERDKGLYLCGLCCIVSYIIFMSTDNAFDYVNQFGFYVYAIVGLSLVKSKYVI